MPRVYVSLGSLVAALSLLTACGESDSGEGSREPSAGSLQGGGSAGRSPTTGGDAAATAGSPFPNGGANAAPSGGSAAAGSPAAGGTPAGGQQQAPGGTPGAGGTAASGGAVATGGSQEGPLLPADCVENLACSLEALPSTGDDYQDCVQRINQFRTQCACLEPLERWTEGESCADRQAEYDSTREAHAGFSERICESGWAQNECPGWRSVDSVVEGCLEMMWHEGPPPTADCSGACYQAHGHFINMTGDYARVACGFYTGSDGEVWSVQNFSN